MGARSKSVPMPTHTGVGKLTVINGRQAVLLPENVHVDATYLDVVQHGSGLTMKPVRRRMTREQVEAWFRSMDELDAGEVIPGGRNQGVTEPEEIFPTGFFDEPGE
jgi:virulence-associated protein VagC